MMNIFENLKIVSSSEHRLLMLITLPRNPLSLVLSISFYK